MSINFISGNWKIIWTNNFRIIWNILGNSNDKHETLRQKRTKQKIILATKLFLKKIHLVNQTITKIYEIFGTMNQLDTFIHLFLHFLARMAKHAHLRKTSLNFSIFLLKSSFFKHFDLDRVDNSMMKCTFFFSCHNRHYSPHRSKKNFFGICTFGNLTTLLIRKNTKLKNHRQQY